ncbi:hypothetical protein D3C87_1879080 [compost metagenome]
MALDSLASLGAAAGGLSAARFAEDLSPLLSVALSVALSADFAGDVSGDLSDDVSPALSPEPGSFSSGLGNPPPKATGVAAPRLVAGAMAATWLA